MRLSRAVAFGAATMMMASVLLASPGAVSFRTVPGFHSTMPAGFAVVQLKPSGAMLSLMGLIECSEIEGLQQVSQGLHAKVVSARGIPLQQFPRHFSFRVTASLRKMFIDGPDRSLTVAEDPRDLLLKLGFRLKVYDGLDMHEVTPDSVTMIGVPAEIESDERVFRVSFDVGEVPVTDRMILEVTTPEGEDLTHFPFGLL
ncbi:MAG TPA: hypothetical protein VKE93_08685 [Candidatus Angelobacter sp.]|nr:hypothetical protein [Candidatus Angelobacter sp.]